MRIFIGRSSRLWVVEPNKGKVKRLPLTMPGLVFWTFLTVGAGVFGLDFLNRTGFSPKLWYDIITRTESTVELDKKSQELNALVARLQHEKDQASRLNQRLASKLENLEGALGSVASDVFSEGGAAPGTGKSSKNSASNKQVKLLKPASLGMGQRLTIRKIDRIIGQLRQLPHHPPVEFPVVNSGFGGRHSPHGIGSTFHRGVDFSLRRSTKILAAGQGEVLNVGYMRGYGLYIDIKHSKDIVTRYAHLARSNVSKGQKVEAGSTIAVGGSSGSSTGAHLHFEVIVKGRSRDPMMFLSIPQKLQMVLKESASEHNIG